MRQKFNSVTERLPKEQDRISGNSKTSEMENYPIWAENRGGRNGGIDVKSNYANNLTMNNFKRLSLQQPPPPLNPNTTYHKSEVIENGVKQFSKDLCEFVKPAYKPKIPDSNHR